MVSQKEIKDLVKRHAGVFKALEEFEKTGKVILKTRMNFTIDRELAKKFREMSRQERFNMSKKIEECIRKIVN